MYKLNGRGLSDDDFFWLGLPNKHTVGLYVELRNLAIIVEVWFLGLQLGLFLTIMSMIWMWITCHPVGEAITVSGKTLAPTLR